MREIYDFTELLYDFLEYQCGLPPEFEFDVIVRDEYVVDWVTEELDRMDSFYTTSHGGITIYEDLLHSHLVLKTILTRFGGGINDVG